MFMIDGFLRDDFLIRWENWNKSEDDKVYDKEVEEWMKGVDSIAQSYMRN